jgi:hypothetical protein
VTTPVFASPAAGVTISAYLEDYKATDPNTKATIGGMILWLARKATDTGVNPDVNEVELRANCSNLFRTGAAAAIVALCPHNAAAPVDENEENIVAIRINAENAVNWLADLVSAGHKKSLTEQNVEGYFAMLNHVGTKASAVASLVNKISPFFPDNVGDAGFRDLLAPGIWTTYRVSRVATGTILKKLLDDFRAMGITTDGDATEVAIEASAAAPWDLNLSLGIQNKYKAYGCIFLEAAGTPIEKWYQGNKAKDELPAVRVRGAKEIFRRYLEVKNEVRNLDGITTVDGFDDPAVTGFW